MTDTNRALAQHLLLGADNTSGQIEPQDYRDVLVSVMIRHHAKNYNFGAITGSAVSSGTLTGASLATITFTTTNPCPWGVNGSDANHYLYISGGTGTAEPVLISGGTAVAGGTSGTITFTPANNHTGAWTITSATGGIKEADIAGGASVPVFLDPNTYTLRGPCQLTAGSSLIGAGTEGVFVVNAYTGAGHGITVTGSSTGHIEVCGFTIYFSGTQSSGYSLIQALSCTPNIHDIWFDAAKGQLLLDSCSQAWVSRTMFIRHTETGMQIGGSTGAVSVMVSDFQGSTSSADAVTVKFVSGTLHMTNFDIQHSQTTGTVDRHIYVCPGNGQIASESVISNGILDGGKRAALEFGPSGTGAIYTWTVTNVIFTGGNSSAHFGILTATVCQDMHFSHITMTGVGTATFTPFYVIGGQTITLDNIKILDCQAANMTCLIVGSVANIVTNFQLTNSTIGYTTAGVRDTNCDYAVDFAAVNHVDVLITGNKLFGNVKQYNNVPTTKTRWQVAANFKQTIVLASAATLAFDLYDDGQVIELTGSTGVATAITGLREGQFGTFIATNAGNVAFSAVATIAKAFTALQNIPVPFVVYGGKLYGTAYVS